MGNITFNNKSKETLSVVTFNCKSFKSSINEIKALCCTSDVIFLQETWLLDFDLPMLAQVDSLFYGAGITAVDTTSGLLSGRPYGGLAVLWRKSLGSQCKPIIYDHKTRLMGFELVHNGRLYSFINVYLPYCCQENQSEFARYLALVDSLVTQANTSFLYILGTSTLMYPKIMTLVMNCPCLLLRRSTFCLTPSSVKSTPTHS